MFHSRISVIRAHSRDPKTQQLYQPLRKTFLADTTAKKQILYDASHHSHVSRLASPHTYAQNHKLGQETLILQDVSLRPTHKYQKIPKNRVYSVINAQQKVYAPISAQQMQKRIQSIQKKQQVIVYTYGDDQQLPIKIQPTITQTPPVKVSAVRPKSGLKVTQPKYNLFSVIDEPLNNLFSGRPCTCPANQLIASQRSEVVGWDQIKHHIQ